MATGLTNAIPLGVLPLTELASMLDDVVLMKAGDCAAEGCQPPRICSEGSITSVAMHAIEAYLRLGEPV